MSALRLPIFFLLGAIVAQGFIHDQPFISWLAIIASVLVLTLDLSRDYEIDRLKGQRR